MQPTLTCLLPRLPLQIWDITGGRQIHEFKHDNAITGIEFHPHEFIIGSCSTDKTARLWDLERFEPIETFGPETTGVRTVAFHGGGRHLLTALQDGLRVWGWEPTMQHDNVDVNWTKVRPPCGCQAAWIHMLETCKICLKAAISPPDD